jgi:PPOX class probable F420-dependent enzyme
MTCFLNAIKNIRHAEERSGGARLEARRIPMQRNAAMLTERQRAFLDRRRVGHLATADAGGAPHLIPVCYAVDGMTLYITIDEKPKRQERPLKRLRNILENPQAAFIVDRYDEDWHRLGWVMLRGRAEILDSGVEHDHAQALLTARYKQYRAMNLAGLPVIALRIARATDWGDLSDE